MKRHLNPLVAILILVGALTVSTQAQTAGAQRVVANIPFAFNVGNTKLPAGKYSITVLNPSSDRKILQIRSTKGSSATVQTTAESGNISDDAKLVFHRYGDRYFFAQVQMAGDSTSFAAVKSNTERAEKLALGKRKQSVLVIVASN